MEKENGNFKGTNDVSPDDGIQGEMSIFVNAHMQEMVRMHEKWCAFHAVYLNKEKCTYMALNTNTRNRTLSARKCCVQSEASETQSYASRGSQAPTY